MSRAELARLTGISPQAVANIVAGLIEDGLAREAGRKKSVRGQPPITIEIADDGGYALGIRIDATSYNSIAVSLSGEPLSKLQGKVAGEDVIDLIRGIHRHVSAAYPGKRCFGLGIVTPGPFDTTWPGVPPPGAVPSLQSHAAVQEISLATGTDVFHANDAYAAAIGEKLYGAAKDLHDFFYLYIGEGVGGGIVIGGEAYRGVGGNGGEAGHLIIDPNGRSCYCGNRGCLGQYLSLAALRTSVSHHGDEVNGYSAWMKDATHALRNAVSTIENLFDPQSIILGGSADLKLLEDLSRNLLPLAPSVRQDHADRIRISTLGEESAAYGASALPLLAVTSSGALSG